MQLSVIFRANVGESLFQYGDFLDRQIGMEPLIIDWAKEETKMAKIVCNIRVLLVIILFFKSIMS